MYANYLQGGMFDVATALLGPIVAPENTLLVTTVMCGVSILS